MTNYTKHLLKHIKIPFVIGTSLLSSSFNSNAEVLVFDAPIEENIIADKPISETLNIESISETKAVETDTGADKNNVVEVKETVDNVSETVDSNEVKVSENIELNTSGPGAANTENSLTKIITASQAIGPGLFLKSSANSGTPLDCVSVSINITLVSPITEKDGQNLTKARLKLSDGSVINLDYDKKVNRKYYKLIRECTESDGTSWYSVAIDGTKVGDYSIDNGLSINELLLSKEDCAATNTVSVEDTDSKRMAVLNTALSLLGKGYEYAGNGPDKFDCSGLVKYVFDQNGFSLPRTSTELKSVGTEVSENELKPGDILARTGHAGIYIGNGYFIHASGTDVGVVVENLETYNKLHPFTSYRSMF